jgi:RNA polymerase sigma-70 factor (ECF subfamily)
MTDNGQPAENEETRLLLLRAQAGDTRAFDELFAQHRPALLSVVDRRLGKSLRGRIDPSDVVQEAQLEVIERMADYVARRPMPFRTWLLRTAVERLWKLRRHAAAARRDIGREQPLPNSDSSSRGHDSPVVAAGSTPSQQAVACELASRLHSVLERLPEPDRTILGMRAFEGLSYEEAGSQLEIDPAAARKRYGRALLRLRALLLADGLTESHL